MYDDIDLLYYIFNLNFRRLRDPHSDCLQKGMFRSASKLLIL